MCESYNMFAIADIILTIANHCDIFIEMYHNGLDVEQVLEFKKIKKPTCDYNDDDNRIALYCDCTEVYLIDPNLEDYQIFLIRKVVLARTYKGKLAAIVSEFESEIADIVKAISGIDKTTELKSFIDVLTLDKKIKLENHLLHISIEDDVIRYYPYIETQYSLLDGADGNTFNAIRLEITVCHEKLE